MPGDRDDFVYDNETPRHRVWLEDFEIADRCVTAGEYLDFIADGGYETRRCGSPTAGAGARTAPRARSTGAVRTAPGSSTASAARCPSIATRR